MTQIKSEAADAYAKALKYANKTKQIGKKVEKPIKKDKKENK